MISGSMFRLAAKWIAVSVLLLGVRGSRAHAMQLTPVQKQEMKQHYEKATRAYDVQKYSEAVDEYQRAYEIGGDPAMLYNVAQSYRLNDQPADALRFYRRYLQRSPNARNRDDVERKIGDLEKVVEERRRKAAAAPPPPPPPAPVVVAPPPPPEVPVKQVEASPGRRIAGIVIASVGAVALATAAITGKMASDKAAKLSDASKVGDVFDPNLEKNGKALNNVAIVSGIVGGAAIVTGVVLILTSRGSSSRERQAMVSPMVGGGGLVGATALVQF